jgi:hypothetical protein
MRLSTLVGVALIVGWAFVFFRGGGYTSRRKVLDVGGVTVSAAEQHRLAPYVAGLALLAGVVLVVRGVRSSA